MGFYMNKQFAFTLIELMITVVIISILAGIAYPSYQEIVMKARRVDAKGALIGLENAMERHFTESNSYLGAGTVGGNTGAPTVFFTSSPTQGSVVYYQLTISAVTATSYSLAATPTGLQANDKCGALTLTSVGVKDIVDEANGVTVGNCW